MIPYYEAKARAMHSRSDWNERTEIVYARITWYDAEYEHDFKISNDDHMSDDDFKDYITENAEEFAKEDAAKNNLIFEGIESIDYTEDYIDDDALFEAEYEAACEFEWECENNR